MIPIEYDSLGGFSEGLTSFTKQSGILRIPVSIDKATMEKIPHDNVFLLYNDIELYGRVGARCVLCDAGAVYISVVSGMRF